MKLLTVEFANAFHAMYVAFYMKRKGYDAVYTSNDNICDKHKVSAYAPSYIFIELRDKAEATIHDMRDMSDGEVYDDTQTNEKIRDGDILLMSDNRVALLFKAWPAMIVGDSNALHKLDQAVTWMTFENGAYNVTAQCAAQLVGETLKCTN